MPNDNEEENSEQGTTQLRDPMIKQVCIEGIWVNPANVAQVATHGHQARIMYAGGGEQLFNLSSAKVASYLDLCNHTDQTLIMPRGAPAPAPAPTRGKLPPAARAPRPGLAASLLAAPVEEEEEEEKVPEDPDAPKPTGGLAPGIQPRKRPTPPESSDE